MKEKPPSGQYDGSSTISAIAFTLALQAVAMVFFLGDAISDILYGSNSWLDYHKALELLIAFALVAGVLTGAMHIRNMHAESRNKSAKLAMVRGALGEVMQERFQRWKLTAAEQEVAIYALKGFDIAEIAKLRDTATGTVRALLSRVYSKAGVSGQTMLISLFMEEMIDLPQTENTDQP